MAGCHGARVQANYILKEQPSVFPLKKPLIVFLLLVFVRMRASLSSCAALRGNPAFAASSGCASIRRFLWSRKSNTVFAFFLHAKRCLSFWVEAA
jgi:hypothetical protein